MTTKSFDLDWTRKQIEQYLSYPSWLVNRNIEGQVKGHLVISNKKLIGYSFKTTSPSLKNYIVFVLKRALTNNTLENFNSNERFLIPLSFDFVLGAGLETELRSVGQGLSFYRQEDSETGPVEQPNKGFTDLLFFSKQADFDHGKNVSNQEFLER